MKNVVKNSFQKGYVPMHDIDAENHILGICIFDGTEMFVKTKI